MKTKIAKSDVDEIKSLAAPPEAVITVLSVTMLLLGNKKHVAKSYPHVKKQLASIGPQAVQTRTSQVNVDLIPVEVAQLARQWHGDLSQEKNLEDLRRSCFLL